MKVVLGTDEPFSVGSDEPLWGPMDRWLVGPHCNLKRHDQYKL